MKRCHDMPFGAAVIEGGVRFRLWAPAAKTVDLMLHQANGEVLSLPMAQRERGWFEHLAAEARHGSHYQYLIDGKAKVPDPASRYNPGDVHGASEVVDPVAFEWSDAAWTGRPWHEAAIYELHVGAFTEGGRFGDVQGKLAYLRDLGVTAIELMPLADFPGRRNWGYDGVLPFAPDASYGRPEDLKHLVDAAHAAGLAVVLDVVYNHFGPEGNYLHAYAPQFFTDRHKTPWGAALNFDGAGSRVVRDFFIHNALYWLEEFHFDGLRFDAVHAIPDESRPDLLTELAEKVRAGPGRHRHVHLVLENDRNESSRLARGAGSHPLHFDAQWNDDFHHCMHAILTGESDGYYADYAGRAVQLLGRCLGEGFAWQGERSPFRGEARGEPSTNLPSQAFVSFLQNHDQIGNRAFGERLSQLSQPDSVRAALTLLLLAPSPPLLFMGEEFGACTPFLFFCDFGPELAQAVTEGRRKEFASFARFRDPQVMSSIADPSAEETFTRSRLDWKSLEQTHHANWLELCRSLLALRQTHIVPLFAVGPDCHRACRPIQAHGLEAMWRFPSGMDLRLRANLGPGEQAGFSPAEHGERLLHAFPHGERHPAGPDSALGPWSVVWTYRPAGGFVGR